ncbi:MAG: DUF975 family protein [Ruminococcaceae bacterium]|nr:DUF975 family protein [Oscillospiraceae bacterium]
MRIDRRDLKWRARDAMRAACPNALFMTLMYLLFTAGLEGVVGWLATDPLSKLLQLSQQGLALDRAIPLVLTGVGRVGVFLNLLLTIFGVVMDFGYKFWCLNTARGEQGEIGALFTGFSMVGRILWLRVLILVYGLLWYVAIFMPAALVLMFGMLIPLVGPVVCVGVFVLAVGVWISRILRYTMSVYCLADDPEMGASWALRRSRWMMEGRVLSYVLLMLSFIGWYLLGGLIVTAVEGVLMLTLGGAQVLMDSQTAQAVGSSPLISILPAIASWPLSLWLKPYVTMTECNFYEQIKGGTERASV